MPVAKEIAGCHRCHTSIDVDICPLRPGAGGSNKSLLGCALDVGFSLHQFLFARMGALVPGLVAVLSTCVLAAVEIALVRSLARMGASVYG